MDADVFGLLGLRDPELRDVAGRLAGWLCGIKVAALLDVDS